MKEDIEEMEDIALKRTTLKWDDYTKYLMQAIEESNFMKRAEDKPMQTSPNSLEKHITSRAIHVKVAAEIAKEIAEGLGLNADYIYTGMLMHDAGHPFAAHDGEEIFTGIAELYNVEYYHHNAKGIETITSENICEKAINKIPNIERMPTLKKELEEEFYYFLDVVISHDGEASQNEMNATPKEYDNIKEAVLTKLRLSNSQNDYKFIAQTIEGRIAKYADVIAYLSSDIQDRFRLGIQKNFDSDYLEFLGEIFADDSIEKREDKIEIAKNIIEKIKEEKLMQLVKDASAEENKEIIKEANELVKEIYSSVDDYENLTYEKQRKQAEKIMEDYAERYKNQHNYGDLSNRDKKNLNANITKIKEFARNKLKMRSSVIEEITSRVRKKMIQDLIINSKSQGDLAFSSHMKDLFFRAKSLNYKYISDTKWDYLAEKLPVATYKLVGMVALALKRTGVIEDKFYDPVMRKYVEDKDALKYLETLGDVDDKKRDEHKKKYGIRVIKRGSKFSSQGKRGRNVAKQELCNAAYHNVLDSGELFAIQYQNAYYAVENQIMSKVKNAIGKLPEKEKQARKTGVNFYDNKVSEQEEKIKEEFVEKYGDIENATQEQLEEWVKEFAKPMIEQGRINMENKMAIQTAINYISGMGDATILRYLEECGFLDPEIVKNSVRRNDGKDLNKKYNMTVPSVESKEEIVGSNEGR